MPHFDNRFIRELPGDPESRNFPRQVYEALWSPVTPSPVAHPKLLAASSQVAQMLDLPLEALSTSPWLDALAGNQLLPGMVNYATNYGGYQFGRWAGQLGDGRAIFLGELLNSAGQRFELQLKGAGPTPYSRRADGRAVLRSSLREFLCSEAMYHLGIPTTRALSLVATGELVERDMFYDGNPVLEPGAAVCRVAPSFTRFGHFELPASRSDKALLRKLVDFTLARDFPEFRGDSDAALAHWFTEICTRTARLMVDWLRVGFVHGVMNTDNMSILGLTIDYGPYGWLDNFDPAWTPNTTDASGRRYCFGRQPAIALWNLEQLSRALGLLCDDAECLAEGLLQYKQCYEQELQRAYCAKLGFSDWQSDDAELLERLFELLVIAEVDMSIFFRRLALLDPSKLQQPAQPSAQLSILHEAFYSQEKFDANEKEFTHWLERWAQRIRSGNEAPATWQARMNAANPCYVLRNYLAQQAIEHAVQGDTKMIEELLSTLSNPYTEQEGRAAFAAKRPEWARHKAGCSMLSCSS